MTDIDLTKLPGEWREIERSEDTWPLDGYSCADQLGTALPKPTIFSLDPLSWPDHEQEVVCRFASTRNNIEAIMWDKDWEMTIIDEGDSSRLIGGTWWPLNGLFGEVKS
jgi:hypothetical protein